MQIVVNLKKEIVADYYQRGSPLLFNIFWKHETLYYPADDWLDFGIVVLGWWFTVADQLRQGVIESTFSFMDGPYSIQIFHDPITGFVTLVPRNHSERWRLPLTQLAMELLSAANEVSGKLAEFRVAEQDRLHLEALIKQLRLKFEFH